ncbi:C-_U-editing enzyme APOBEC-1-like [Catharus ustulatus]|uniref:C->U-editing enzyme APOBEC-1-like n=1 Tax=Catharus ustulatus TaxID=91951 RepID=UPI00140D94EB|nr:C->U-editing enzyme APOBEC-1-like [Catharus ustulatus]
MHQRGRRGMYISRRALRQQFDPRTYPREAYLLCKLQWGARGRNWIHWARNDEINDYHVERYFLEQIFEPRNYSFCDMTWYLSWSPCAGCCDIIQDFLEEQHNVHLDIHVARIYYAHVPRNRAGLRQLARYPGVNIQTMNVEDYKYCWDTFLQKEGYFDFTARSFQLEIERSHSTLEEIIAGLHL